MKKLVIAEKPSVGRDIARVMGCNKGSKSYLEGKDYIVTWAMGHLVQLAPPAAYNKKYENWALGDLPIIPKTFQLELLPKTKGQFFAIRKLIERNDIGEVIIATDAGREGELVARWILEMANCRLPIKRLWISSVTDQAIKQGFQGLRDGRNYEGLYFSALTRAKADWLVGLNGTRALTTKYNAQLSLGRVQTPTLAMVTQREDHHKSFRPKRYYAIEVTSKGHVFTWEKAKDKKWFEEDKVKSIAKKLQGNKFTVKEVKSKEKKRYPMPLYDLTTLQQVANERYDFSAKKTLNLLQRLYERHKIVSYPRTDSRYLTSDMKDTLVDRLRAIRRTDAGNEAKELIRSGIDTKGVINNKKVTDHHGLVPTEVEAIFQDLSHDERVIYELVCHAFVKALSPPTSYVLTTISLENHQEVFVLNTETDGLLEEFKEGEQVKGEVEVTMSLTKPLPLFTEGSLLKAMENPSAYMEDSSKDLRQILKDTGGLGTVATRADIIEKLVSSGLIALQGKNLTSTSKGRQLLELVPEQFKSPFMTAKWERNLEKIAKGSLDHKVFINEISSYTKTLVRDIKESEASYRHDNLTSEKCPVCGDRMLRVKTKHGVSLVCKDPACGKRVSVARVTNARCPNCHKKLTLRGSGDKKVFTCTCGYKEKLEVFEKRKAAEKPKVSKKEVQKYLKKDEEAPTFNPFEEALKKLKNNE